MYDEKGDMHSTAIIGRMQVKMILSIYEQPKKWVV
jgi:hypothetical protein